MSRPEDDQIAQGLIESVSEWQALDLDMEFPHIYPSSRTARLIIDLTVEARALAYCEDTLAESVEDIERLNLELEPAEVRRETMATFVGAVCNKMRKEPTVEDPVGQFVNVVSAVKLQIDDGIQAGYFRSKAHGQTKVVTDLTALLAQEADLHAIYIAPVL